MVACRLVLAFVLVIPMTLTLGAWAGSAIGRASTTPTSYRDQRLSEISADLRRIDGDYLLAIGDSHVARWPARTFCGLPVVNAGVNGATVRRAGSLLSALVLPRPPRAIMVTVGTNDANRKRFRDTKEAVSRFRQSFQPWLRTLSQKAGLVVFTGVPPLDESGVRGFSSDAAVEIGVAAEATCRASASCRVASGFRRDDRVTDGLHLADYEQAYARIAPTICAELAGQRSVSPAAIQNADAGEP